MGAASGEDQATRDRRRRAHVPGFQIDCGSPLKVGHVGIVFVHGIGTQAAGETLLDWSSKLIALLLDARAIARMKGDPVIDCQLDPGPSGSRFIELRLPEGTTPDGHHVVPEQHWVMTEAWWAERVRPPSFGDMAEWLGPRGAVRRIVTAMLPHRSDVHDPRTRPHVEPTGLVLADERSSRLREAGRALADRLLGRGAAPRRKVVKEAGSIGKVYSDTSPRMPLLDLATDAGTLLLSLGAGLYFQAISALVLVLYGALRSIEKLVPIGPLKGGALTRPIDRFVLDWFGDVFVLLRDPAQAASVRGRLIDAIRDLQSNDCSPIVVVAHSGGAIVSYMTLADETLKDLPVDRLVTLGEGLNLAWRLLAGNDGIASEETRRRYDRLYTDMLALRPNLRWDDFWASADPAPVGVLEPEPDVLGSDSLKKITSHAVWNRLSFREDHGTYWDNDEEFLIPLARLIDANPAGAREFLDSERDVGRSVRRRRRLTFLSVWRQLALVAATGSIVLSYLFGMNAAFTTGKFVADTWGAVPGHEAISNTMASIRDMHLEGQADWRGLAENGNWVIVVVLGLLTLVSLIAPGERPVPWNNRTEPWYRPFNLFSLFWRVIPFLVGIPVAIAVGMGALTFARGATEAGAESGVALLRIVVGVTIAAAMGYLLFRSRWTDRWWVRHPRNGVEVIVTIGVMAVIGFLAITPIVAVLVFWETGQEVLGFATIIVAFQVLARIGTWRWAVWDDRERVAMRSGQDYPSLLRIFFQMGLLLATCLVGFAAVVVNSPDLARLAVGGGALAVLLGVAVDVMDVARGARRNPGDAMSPRRMTL